MVKGTGPRGRTLALATMLLLALGAGAGTGSAAAAAPTAPATVASVATYPWLNLVAPAPGGRMLVISSGPGTGSTAADPWQSRADLLDGATGRRAASFSLGTLLVQHPADHATALNDGSMELIGTEPSTPAGHDVVAHVGPGTAVSMHDLPVWPAQMSAEAIAPTGDVWQGLACQGVVTRTDVSGQVHHYRLPAAACGAGFDVQTNEERSAFTVGPDGAAWLSNACIGQVSKIPLVGRARTWRFAPVAADCRQDDGDPTLGLPRAVATPDGGLAYPGGRITGAGTVVTGPAPLPAVTTQDGGQWTIGDENLVEQPRQGAPITIPVFQPDGRSLLSWTLGPDSRLWYSTASPFGRGMEEYDSPAVSVVGGTEASTSQLLPAFDANGAVVPGRDATIYGAALVAPSPDGSVWVTMPDAGGANNASPLLRLTPQPALRPARPRAIVTSLGARKTATQWVELTCSSRPGTYCSGSVRLRTPKGASLSSAARYAIAGGSGDTVAVALTKATRTSLRRAALRARVIVTPATGQPRSWKAVRLPRA